MDELEIRYENNLDKNEDYLNYEESESETIKKMVEVEEEMYTIYSILQRNTNYNKNDLLQYLTLKDVYDFFEPDYRGLF